jgi:hypothetical protein
MTEAWVEEPFRVPPGSWSRSQSAQYEIPYYWRFEIDVDAAGLGEGVAPRQRSPER